MHILHVMGMKSTKFGGLERFLLQLMYACPDYVFTFLYEEMPQSLDFVGKIKKGGGKIVVLKSAKFNAIKNIPQFWSLCKKEHFDVIHFHFENSYVYWAPIAKGLGAKKIIKTIHSCMTTCEGKQAQGKSDLSFSLRLFSLYGLGYHWVDNIVCVSQYTKRQFIKIWGYTQKVECVYLGTNALRRLSLDETQQLKKHLGIPITSKVVATTLFANPIKGADVLIKSIPNVSVTDVVYVFIGLDENVTFTHQLHQLAESLGVTKKIRWIGITNQVEAYLSLADVYVQPSRTEALGLAACEAMSLSLPIVASNVGGLSELTSILFPVENFKSLADCLDRLLLDKELCKNEGKKNKAFFENNLTYDASIKRYKEIYETGL